MTHRDRLSEPKLYAKMPWVLYELLFKPVPVPHRKQSLFLRNGTRTRYEKIMVLNKKKTKNGCKFLYCGKNTIELATCVAGIAVVLLLGGLGLQLVRIEVRVVGGHAVAVLAALRVGLHLGQIVIDVLVQVDLARVHLARALHIDLLRLEKVVELAILLLLDAGEGVDGVAARIHLDVEAAVGAAGAGKVDILHVLEADKDGRLVDEHEAPLQGVDEAGGGLVGAGDGGRAGVAHEAAGDGDLAVDERFHEFGDEFEGGTLHLLLQLALVLVL
jgi:hypothetical protein